MRGAAGAIAMNSVPARRDCPSSVTRTSKFEFDGGEITSAGKSPLPNSPRSIAMIKAGATSGAIPVRPEDTVDWSSTASIKAASIPTIRAK
jgi:hypothetical protein